MSFKLCHDIAIMNLSPKMQPGHYHSISNVTSNMKSMSSMQGGQRWLAFDLNTVMHLQPCKHSLTCNKPRRMYVYRHEKTVCLDGYFSSHECMYPNSACMISHLSVCASVSVCVCAMLAGVCICKGKQSGSPWPFLCWLCMDGPDCFLQHDRTVL